MSTRPDIRYAWNTLLGREIKRRDAQDPDEPGYANAPETHKNHYSASIGMKNPEENNYDEIVPYDRTLVIVGGRYLNADWVRELYGGHWWIATQGPIVLPADFSKKEPLRILSLVDGYDNQDMPS